MQEWQHYYNWDRVHGSIGKPLMEKFHKLIQKTPFWDDVIELFDAKKEHIQEQEYKIEEALRELKRSL